MARLGCVFQEGEALILKAFKLGLSFGTYHLIYGDIIEGGMTLNNLNCIFKVFKRPFVADDGSVKPDRLILVTFFRGLCPKFDNAILLMHFRHIALFEFH